MATKKKSAVQSPIRVGNTVHVRTVTHYYVGRIALIQRDEIVLVDASWVAWPTETFEQILSTGKISDTQRMPNPVALGRGAIVDVTDWPFALPAKS